ncbi:hypothetical protein QWA68_015426 [Fusarium oxysporum]|nr:hypothetical protein QWA68_015426 [Fusarium oxysporum]
MKLVNSTSVPAAQGAHIPVLLYDIIRVSTLKTCLGRRSCGMNDSLKDSTSRRGVGPKAFLLNLWLSGVAIQRQVQGLRECIRVQHPSTEAQAADRVGEMGGVAGKEAPVAEHGARKKLVHPVKVHSQNLEICRSGSIYMLQEHLVDKLRLDHLLVRNVVIRDCHTVAP